MRRPARRRRGRQPLSASRPKLQGIAPFCLTVDRHDANYLPALFGAHRYALLTQPAMLPAVLLD